MEWAAGPAGADVVNMSLGGGVTDGTDPLSQAVDRITEQTGTLFVIAAGNLGAAGVSSPGSASSALTVGSVSKSEQLAGSSGRGPRRGDFAIKPDLTAPGVDIVAARATGTALGTPVDELYTSASGTSMATPHAAGAAAILAQQHPDWDWSQLKAALASTGVPRTGLTVYQQGGGRLDLAAATGTSVLASPAPLDLGHFPYPHDGAEPVSRPVTYTNWSHQHASIDQAQFRLYEDGVLVAEADRPSGEFPLSPEPSQVRMELDVSRDVDWWTMSTRTSMAWEFATAPPPAGGTGVVPMLLVDYDVAVDLLNTALPVGDPPPFVELQVRHQPGAEGPPVAGARLWVSYDDGQTWLERPVRLRGDGEFQAVLPFRARANSSGFASLRVEAWDTAGNRIEQEIIRAVTTS